MIYTDGLNKKINYFLLYNNYKFLIHILFDIIFFILDNNSYDGCDGLSNKFKTS